MTDPGTTLRVAIAGLGAVGLRVLEAIEGGELPGFEVSAVAARDQEAARQKLRRFPRDIAVVGIDALEPYADLVVECAPAELLSRIAGPFLRKGKKAIVLSMAGMFGDETLIEVAREHGGQIIVPSGALLGLDAVMAAAEGQITSIRIVTRKPVRGLVGAPYLVENSIEIEDSVEAVRVFSGTAREAAAGFPANVNVAAALALAGIGPDRTMIEIWADPALTRNTHRIEVESDSAFFSMSIENIPTENPKTGRITALSVIATLRKLNAPVRVGT